MFFDRLWLLGFELVIVAVAVLGAYGKGRQDERTSCVVAQAQAQLTAEQQTKTEATKTIARATRTGTAREADRAALDRLFDRLAEEARHDTLDPVDACELPADRLRRWADANAGFTTQGAAAAEPDRAASAPAAASFWARARLGSQPPAGGPRLSPGGEPAVPAVGLP